MKLRITLILLFICFYGILTAQTPDSIVFVPDRPGMSTPPDILSFERFQLETGFQKEHFLSGSALNENNLFPTVLIRLGLLKNAEARISTDYAYNRFTDSGKTTVTNGLNPISIGTKIKLLKQRQFLPKTSLLVNLTLPWYGKKEFTPLYLAPSVYLLMSNSIFDRLNVCYNYGLEWHGDHSPLSHFYSFCLGLNINKALSIFAEGYGYSGKYKRAKYYYDAGFSCLLNNHLQIDVSAAREFNSASDYYQINAGISWQLAGKKMKF
jgi:hypothetical protein